MSELFSNLGTFFGGAGGKALQTGFTGAGEVGNILDMIQRGQQYSKLKQFENMSPQQLAARVSAGTQPLNAGLVQGVTNAVQGADAERGLATSPGVFNADLSQSLAPFVQQNQSTALQLLMAQMGLPTSAASVLNPTADLSRSMANLTKLWSPQSTAPGDPNAFLDLIWGNNTPSGGGGLVDAPIDFGQTQGATA